ncbi:MAG: ABC transporter ATP-binding protein [Spirochaetia bacterium]|jgi:NitT/TauT family transport system ATP-binding protein|nr:ABC transporter ATP-binding protein [Spirochaetia bacterium]
MQSQVVTTEHIIEVKGISKTYDGGVEAIKNIDLQIPRGELTTLLGPSGCGKTTLLKIIAGLLPPSGGEVLINNKPVHGPGPERAFVFQDFALLPWATVLRNVSFGLELRKMPKAQRHEIARKYISEVGLDGFENSYPHELSGGMRQRVGLARALTVDSDILLMDEPFASVDEQTRRKLQDDLLKLLQIEKKTVIFVTHSIEEAVYVSDKVVLLGPRPSSVMKIIDTGLDHIKSDGDIRRDKHYLDLVEDLWLILKQYLT